MPSAGDRVFGIPELLEKILLYLSFKELFLVQRISKTFQAMINRSTPIRQAMLLETSSQRIVPEDPHGSLNDYHPTHFNPLLRITPHHLCQTLPVFNYFSITTHPIQRDSTCAQLWLKQHVLPFQMKVDKDASWHKTKMIVSEGFDALRLEAVPFFAYAKSRVYCDFKADVTLGEVADRLQEFLESRGQATGGWRKVRILAA